MTQKSSIAATLALLVVFGSPAFAQVKTSVSAEAELGFVKIFYHTYRLGAIADGASVFDFVNQGGQEILYPFQRYTLEATLGNRNIIRFLYQPLQIDTELAFRSNVVLDGITFPANTPMRMTYSFPFYRITYLYRILNGSFTVDAGAALQLRNASIRFARLDGLPGISVSQNLGLVPAVAVAAAWRPTSDFSLGMDATGLWASSSIINGANFQFEGSILDASLKAALTLAPGAQTFLNLRFLGGSASGISRYTRAEWSNSISPETENRLATASVTLGIRVEQEFLAPK
jgi:hypothetical protein